MKRIQIADGSTAKQCAEVIEQMGKQVLHRYTGDNAVGAMSKGRSRDSVEVWAYTAHQDDPN